MPAATFEASTPAFAQTKPCRVSAITRSPRRATTRRSRGRRRGAGRSPATTRPSAFDTTFCVTTTTSPSRERAPRSASASERRQVVAGSRPRGGPGRARPRGSRQQLRAPRGRRASAPRVVGHDRVGHARSGCPSASTRRPSPASTSSITHADEQAAVVRRRRRPRETSTPAAGISRSAMPRDRGAADDRRDPDDGVAPRGHRVADARAPRGSGRSRRPGSTGRRPPRRPRRSRRGRPAPARARSGALVPDALHLVGRPPPHPVLLEVEVERLARRFVDARRSASVTGSSVTGRMRRRTPNRARDRGRDLGQRSRPRPAARVRIQVRGQVEVAEPEPGVLGAERAELLGRAERLVAAAPSALPVERAAQPVGDGVEVGRHVQPVDVDVVGDVHDDGEVLAGHHAASPRRNFPAPTPPASATTFMIGDRVVGSPRDGRGRRHDAPRRPRRALARAEHGKALSRRRGRPRCLAPAATTSTSCMRVAARLRDLGWGDTVTYSRKVFVPLTMLCRDHCHYCTFAKPPAKLDAPFLTPDEVVAIAEAGARARAARRRCSRWATAPRTATPRRASGSPSAATPSTLDYVRAVADPRRSSRPGCCRT